MNYKVYLLILLGALSAFGPFVTDMYLPSLPSMVDDYDTSVSMVQMGLSFSMIGLALGQLIFGPLSDKYGRRKPVIMAMIVFCISTLACIVAPTIEVFVALRLIQGLSGAGGIVISRSVATDTFDGHQLLKMLAIIGAINGIAPITAPVAGGMIVSSIGWRGIFVVLLIIGLLLTVGSFFMKESLPVERRKSIGALAIFRLFGVVMRNRLFMCYVLQQATAQAILFGNIASSPFIVQTHFGVSASSFGLLFAVNGVFIGVGAALSARFRNPATCVKVSCIGMLVLSVVMAVLLFCGCNVVWYEIVLNPLLGFMGLTFTASTTLALNSERTNAGTASAVFGAIGFLSGGLVTPLMGQGNMLHTAAIVFVVGAVLSIAFACMAKASSREAGFSA
ncbi:MAG: multidrug effflux MFS transporter [Muribaculaceae bacterium]